MSDLKKHDLDLNYGKSKEEIQDEKDIDRYMKIYDKISNVFIEEKVEMIEALEILDTMLAATQLFLANEYNKHEDVNNNNI